MDDFFRDAKWVDLPRGGNQFTSNGQPFASIRSDGNVYLSSKAVELLRFARFVRIKGDREKASILIVPSLDAGDISLRPQHLNKKRANGRIAEGSARSTSCKTQLKQIGWRGQPYKRLLVSKVGDGIAFCLNRLGDGSNGVAP